MNRRAACQRLYVAPLSVSGGSDDDDAEGKSKGRVARCDRIERWAVPGPVVVNSDQVAFTKESVWSSPAPIRHVSAGLTMSP